MASLITLLRQLLQFVEETVEFVLDFIPLLHQLGHSLFVLIGIEQDPSEHLNQLLELRARSALLLVLTDQIAQSQHLLFKILFLVS